jgi:hypothetical protein
MFSYKNLVQKSLGKVEIWIKLLLSINSNLPESFVKHYVDLTHDTQSQHFQHLLELKGLKRIDQQLFLEKFQIYQSHERLPTEKEGHRA